MATAGAILVSALVGTAVSAAVAIPQAIIASKQAESLADYQKAVARSNADYKNQVAQVEAQELARKAKFTFGEQRATAAAMGLGMVGTSVQDIQQMDVGLATLDVQKKLYEGKVALWEGEVAAQMADYQADVAKYNAWSGAATNIIGGTIMGGMGGAFGAASSAISSGAAASTASFGSQVAAGVSQIGYGGVAAMGLQSTMTGRVPGITRYGMGNY